MQLMNQHGGRMHPLRPNTQALITLEEGEVCDDASIGDHPLPIADNKENIPHPTWVSP